MRRSLPLALLALVAAAAPARADAFDYYINPVLTRAVGSDHCKEIAELTPDLISENDRLLRELPAMLR